MRVRPLKAFDLENLMNLRNDLVEFTMSGVSVPDISAQKSWHSAYQQRGDQHIFVLEDDHCRFIGYGQIHLMWGEEFGDSFRGEYVAENGYYIHRQYWGLGYAPFLIDMLAAYAFDYLGVDTVLLRVLGDNARALRAYSKCGFIEAGRVTFFRAGEDRSREIVVLRLNKNERKEDNGRAKT